jgi:hypothetical protein
MKTTITLALCSVMLLLSSCKKMLSKADGTDIAYAVKQGYLYNTWIIDDDDKGNHDATQNSHTYTGEKDPSIFIKKDDTYRLQYFSMVGNNLVTEEGTVSVNVDAKTVTFHPSGKNDYTFNIKCLTTENFTLGASTDKTVYIKNSEGVLVPQTSHTEETLFMEDDD